MERAASYGRAAAEQAAGYGETDPARLADIVTTQVLHVLHTAGCLVEPTPAPPAMTLDEAAKVLIRRARTHRLEAHDPVDVSSVVNVRAQYEFAWAAADRAGIDPADSDLHTARQVLAKHHGLL